MAITKQTKVTIALMPNDKTRLVEYAKARNTTPSAVARDALRLFLESEERLQATEWEGKVEQRMKRLENHLAGLMAKLVRSSAQNLYFTMTPFLKGGWPEDPLIQPAFNEIWTESRQFAADWIKKARTPQDILDEGSNDAVAGT